MRAFMPLVTDHDQLLIWFTSCYDEVLTQDLPSLFSLAQGAPTRGDQVLLKRQHCGYGIVCTFAKTSIVSRHALQRGPQLSLGRTARVTPGSHPI